MPNNDGFQPVRPPCSTRRQSVPDVTVCLHCGAEVEIWSDEDEYRCRSCEQTFLKK